MVAASHAQKKFGRGFWTLPSKPAKQVFWPRPLYSQRVAAAIACCAGAARDELRILDQGQCSLPETETMQESRFREWLDKQEKRGGGPYDPGTVAQYISDAKSVEKIYGNLDELYAKDCIAEVLQELEYAAA